MPLIKALYGHPQSGAMWEKKCEQAIFDAGFERIGQCGEWSSCYVHTTEKLFLMVYVDDFKMTGPAANVDDMWKTLRTIPDQDKPNEKPLH